MAILVGIHPVREAVSAGRPLDRVLIAKGAGGQRIQEIIDLCRRKKIPVRFEPRDSIERLAPGGTHQGVIALGAAHEYAEDIPASAPLIVVLDGVEDPHNLGAIIRTAHAAGAGAILIPERRAAGLNETVAKAAAGALEHIPVVRVVNVSRAIEELKAKGYWIYGIDERGEDRYDRIDYAVPSAIVLGGEGKGLHQQVRNRCDFLLRIPMSGKISSLNVSVAAGVVLFEWRRRRDPLV